ncbi:MAG: IS1595 family transposase [Methyloceanibacter sp.]
MNLTDPRFQNPENARQWLEMQRWPDGVYCSHCGSFSVTPLQGKAHRPGLWQCNDCRQQFTVTTGSVMERSKIPLNKWLMAMHLMASSKKGISAHQLHRMLGITYQSAWFLSHRIREAMDDKNPTPMGGEGKVVEADTTYVGGKEKNKRLGKRKASNIGGMGKQIVHTLVERGGRSRSHHIANVTGKTLRPLLVTNVSRKSTLMTDTHGGYHRVGKEYARHEMVDHGREEYVRGDAHSNTAEGFFSILKRGVTGTFHHISEAHLHRYLAEFDFRYNNRSGLGVEDTERASKIIKQAEGKRLTYRRIGEAQNI